MGENITTRKLDLLRLPAGALLYIGEEAVLEVTGLSDPCIQLDRLHPVDSPKMKNEAWSEANLTVSLISSQLPSRPRLLAS